MSYISVGILKFCERICGLKKRTIVSIMNIKSQSRAQIYEK